MMKYLIVTVLMLFNAVLLMAQVNDIQKRNYKGKIKQIHMFEGESVILENRMEDSSQCTLSIISFDEQGRVVTEEETNYKLGVYAIRTYKYNNGILQKDSLYIDGELIMVRHYKQQTPYLTTVETKDAAGKIRTKGTIELDKSFRLWKQEFGNSYLEYDYMDDDNYVISKKQAGRETGESVMIKQRDKQGNPTVTRIMDEIHVLNPLLRLTSYTYYQ